MRITLALFVPLLIGCAVGPHASNRLVTELSAEDQAASSGQEFARSNQDRVNLVLNELASGRIRTAEDKFNAALILDHSPMTFRDNKLIAKSPDNYLLGHYLAKNAYESGYSAARALVAQTLDRYLSMTTGCQKYGSNRFINQTTGAEELAPVDRATTDEERARYGIAPLATLLKKYPEQKVACSR